MVQGSRETLFNMRTGDQFTQTFVRYKPRFPLRFVGGSYMILFAEGIRRLDKAQLNRVESRVWYNCLKIMSFKAWTVISIRSFAAEIEEDQSAVTKAFKKLVECGLLERHTEKVGSCNQYRLDSDIGWYGNGDDWKEWQIKHNKLQEREQIELAFAK